MGRPAIHGMAKTRIHNIYCDMHQRCEDKNAKNYPIYGGRGITVCDEWRGTNGFLNFYHWSLEHGYAPDLSIDRIDTNGDYKPENCRWVSKKAQARNRRNSRYVVYNGNPIHVLDACKIAGISNIAMWKRVKKGLTQETGLFDPPQKNVMPEETAKEIKELLAKGSKVRTISETFGISKGAIKQIKNGRTWKNIQHTGNGYVSEIERQANHI